MTKYKRLDGEDFDTYALRLYENKIEYDLTSRDISLLLNQESDIQKSESAWRKHYACMRKGIEYQRNLGQRWHCN